MTSALTQLPRCARAKIKTRPSHGSGPEYKENYLTNSSGLIPLVCLRLAQSLAPAKENVNQALEIKMTKFNVTCQIPLIVGLHATSPLAASSACRVAAVAEVPYGVLEQLHVGQGETIVLFATLPCIRSALCSGCPVV